MVDGGRSILVVDDDQEILRAFARTLNHRSQRLTASSSVEAMDLVRRHAPDAVVVDFLLGAENGVDLVREVKAAFPRIKVLLVSGYASIDVIVAAVKAGADDVRLKPIHPREVLRWLETNSWTTSDTTAPSLERMQWEYVRRVLKDCGGNQSEAARRLGVQRATLRSHLHKSMPRH